MIWNSEKNEPHWQLSWLKCHTQLQSVRQNHYTHSRKCRRLTGFRNEGSRIEGRVRVRFNSCFEVDPSKREAIWTCLHTAHSSFGIFNAGLVDSIAILQDLRSFLSIRSNYNSGWGPEVLIAIPDRKNMHLRCKVPDTPQVLKWIGKTKMLANLHRKEMRETFLELYLLVHACMKISRRTSSRRCVRAIVPSACYFRSCQNLK